MFSLSSSATLTTAGEAGIVLSRFFSGATAAAVRDAGVEVAVGRAVRAPAIGLAGVAAVCRAAVGLAVDVRAADGRVAMLGLLVEVPSADRDDVVAGRSEDAACAIDMRLGRAAIPSFLSSPFSSPVADAIEGRLRWAAVAVDGVEVAVEAGLRTVLGTVERIGGLLSEEVVVLVRVPLTGAVLDAVVEGVVLDVVFVVGLLAASGRRAAVVVLGADLGGVLSLALSAIIIAECWKLKSLMGRSRRHQTMLQQRKECDSSVVEKDQRREELVASGPMSSKQQIA
jgi:hypothetical protein